ncbi:NAD(P)H-binding protein [Pediococcus acidilactici]
MTKKVLVLGAHGQIAQLAEKEFMEETDDELKLFLRNAKRLTPSNPDRETVIDGDAANVDQLKDAMQGVDAVYANLAGNNIADQAKAVVEVADLHQPALLYVFAQMVGPWGGYLIFSGVS